MSNALTISGTTYTVTGTVTNTQNNERVEDLHVLIYDNDGVLKDDFLGIGITDKKGTFTVSFDSSKFSSFFDRKPDLFFIIKDGGMELLNTRYDTISDADESTPPINLKVSHLNDTLRSLINTEPAPGWVGGFATSNNAFAYPNPDLSSITPMNQNRKNIPKLQRQLKVVWPEFSWWSDPDGEDKKRCFQMFAPDISRLGYTNEGEVYSIICPQQGAASPNFGSMNVEITVTGNRGWANETNGELAADMSVQGAIWFSPSAQKSILIKKLAEHFRKHILPFPSSKANAIIVNTHKPGEPDQPIFPLLKGQTPESDFKIPDFAKHEGLSWTVGHLGVQIGSIVKKNIPIVDKFNQLVLDIFNTASGNMLKNGNILSWNVWFTAPETVDTQEWKDHTEKWRESINADHGSPEGDGTDPRYFDGTPFKPLKQKLTDELPKIMKFIKENL